MGASEVTFSRILGKYAVASSRDIPNKEIRDVSLFSGGGGGNHYFGGEGHNFSPLVWGRVTIFFKDFWGGS